MRINGFTVQVRVPEPSAARPFYTALFGRGPDLTPHEDFHEWEIVPDGWIQLGPGTVPTSGRVRFGVPDIDAARVELATSHGVDCGATERVPDVVLWCDFDDPWGNRLGLYQVLDET